MYIVAEKQGHFVWNKNGSIIIKPCMHWHTETGNYKKKIVLKLEKTYKTNKEKQNKLKKILKKTKKL